MNKTNPLPSFEEADQHLRYDPETGLLWWKKKRRGANVSSPVGSLAQNGYLRTKFNYTAYSVHRLAWLLATKQDPGEMQIDHINGIKHDNRLANLRLATGSQNCQNGKKPKNNSSGYKGVSWNRRDKCWQAHICVNSKIVRLGAFATAFEGHLAYKKAAQQLHGEFTRQE
jgi:hypothetical protein